MFVCAQVIDQGLKGSAFALFGHLISSVLSLNSEVFREIPLLLHSLPAALLVVFIAGFYQSLSQIVVLFINQVRPLRFVLSLVISALFFVVGYGFWALSTWVILKFAFSSSLSFLEMVRTLGFSYAPLMVFGVFVVLPYFGGGVFVVLSIWTLLAVVVGIETLSSVGRWEAFGSAVLGWIVLQIIQKTVGQPIASLGQWITNWAAGEELITNRMRLAQELYVGLRAQRASMDSMDPTNQRQSQTTASRSSEAYKKRIDENSTGRRKRKGSLSQAILLQSLKDARERLREENRDSDR